MNNCFVLFACCHIVKGATRSMIVDTQRHALNVVPNILAEILEYHQGKTIEEVIQAYGEKHASVIREYFQFLEEKEYIFFTAKERVHYFPSMTKSWDYPGLITNAIIDHGEVTEKHFPLIVKELDHMNCFGVQLRFFSELDISGLEEMLALFDGTRIGCIQLFIVYPSHANDVENTLCSILKNYVRVDAIHVLSAPEEKEVYINPEKEFRSVRFYKKGYQPDSVRYEKRLEDFYNNNKQRVFMESQYFNTYFNKKVYVSGDGYIKNAPHIERVFGSVQVDSLMNVVEKLAFQEFWTIKKDDIVVCKDCEFRHLCIDPRVPIKKNEHEFYFETPCNYDPFTGKWDT